MVEIRWNYDNDANMTVAESDDKVLKAFFSIDDWEFVRHFYRAVLEEADVEYQNRRLDFEKSFVCLGIDDEETIIDKQSCLRSFSRLFDEMIMGANDDHHNIRYEVWWQVFTETNYQLKQKMELWG